MTLGERGEALGEVWHLPAAEPLTGRQFIALVFRSLGRPPRMGGIPRAVIRLVELFSPLVREMVEVLYQFERPFVMNSSKFQREFGLQATPLETAIRQIVLDRRRKE